MSSEEYDAYAFGIMQRVRAVRGNVVTEPQVPGDEVKVGDEGKVLTRKHYPHQRKNVYLVEFRGGVRAYGEETWLEAAQ